MPTLDRYFFEALGMILVAAAFVGAIGYACHKSARVGRIILALFFLIGGSYDLVMCSNTIAFSLRPHQEVHHD